jgi:hypothetical protein
MIQKNKKNFFADKLNSKKLPYSGQASIAPAHDVGKRRDQQSRDLLIDH